MTRPMETRKSKTKWTVKELKTFLAGEATRLRLDCGLHAPPYNLYSVADLLDVQVEERFIPDFDGYIEVRDKKYVAVISTKKHPTRQRFTLGHELGHVVLMKFMENEGAPARRRYRAKKKMPSLHQDPIEESLCNYFAGELLMPANEVKERLKGKTIEPETIFNLGKEFHVSSQAAAVNVIKLRKEIIACTLWSLNSLWPLPVWWVGRKTKLLSELKALEYLVGKRKNCTELWESYGEKDYRFEIRISPTPESRFAMILVRYLDDFEVRRWGRRQL